jgi:hypothetical protein
VEVIEVAPKRRPPSAAGRTPKPHEFEPTHEPCTSTAKAPGSIWKWWMVSNIVHRWSVGNSVVQGR